MSSREVWLIGEVEGLRAFVRARLAGNEVEDAVQETCCRVLEATRSAPAEPRRWRRWVYGVARNVIHEHVRAREAGRRVEPAGELVDRGRRSDARREAAAELGLVLGRLRPEQRLALIAYHVEGEGLRALARRLGRTPGAAKALLYRSRRDLQKALRGGGS